MLVFILTFILDHVVMSAQVTHQQGGRTSKGEP